MPSRAPGHSVLSGSALYEDVITYDSLGEHRTATPPDFVTADWIAGELQAAGYGVGFFDFEVPVFSVERSCLLLDNHELQVFPRWPVSFTGPEGVPARLVEWPPSPARPDADAREGIAFIRMSSGQHPLVSAAAVYQAYAAGAVGAVIVTEGPTGEVVAINTPVHAPPFPIPTVLIGSHAAPALSQAEQSHRDVTLIVEGDFFPEESAPNVLGRFDCGSDQWIVIITPQSGWFHCAGERGPGIALLLGLARWAAPRAKTSNIMVASCSGHELGMIGENMFIEELAPLPPKVKLWIHLGASIGTRDWERMPTGLVPLPSPSQAGHLVAHSSLHQMIRKSFAGYGSYEQPYDTQAFLNASDINKEKEKELFRAVPGFDERDLFAYSAALRAGYEPSVGLFGTHMYFHTPRDRPMVTSPKLLEPVAKALKNIIDHAGV